MIIQSDYLTEGLFGQIFIWMLEILPYIDAQKWKPQWRIRSRNYGQPPDYNIFPGIIRTRYAPEGDGEIVSLEKLKEREGVHFKDDFREANRRWQAHFAFTDDVYERLDQFWQTNFQGQTVLGVHYRGTDKNTELSQTNPVSRFQFLCIVEDFLKAHPDVTAIFVASDDARFTELIQDFPHAHHHAQSRSTDDQPLWNNHDASTNLAHAKDAILDSLSLARCRYVLKCMSQLSGFAKIFNPDLEVYRIAAMKQDWFPDAYIPPYRSQDKAVRSLLRALRPGDVHTSFAEKAAWRTERFVARAARRIAKLRHHSSGVPTI